MSRPASFCCCTRSRMAPGTRGSALAASTWPARAALSSARSSGGPSSRPAWVVRIRSTLRCIVTPGRLFRSLQCAAMKKMFPLFGTLVLALSAGATLRAQEEVSLDAPGGIQAAIQELIPGFEHASPYKVKATFGSGLGTKKQVADGVPFDVPIIQPPYPEVLDSGHVVVSSATPLARVAVGVAVRTGQKKPDISTPAKVKALLLSVKSFSYPDPSGGAAAGVSFTKTLQDLGIYEQVKPKIHLSRGGAAAMEAVAKGEVEIGLTFYSEILTEKGIEAVGTLPESICPPTALVAFVSTHAKNPEAANTLVRYLSSPEAAATYRKVSMEPAPKA